MWGAGWAWGWWWWACFLFLFVFLVWLLAVPVRRRRARTPEERILRERLARGEITKEEYDRRMRNLRRAA